MFYRSIGEPAQRSEWPLERGVTQRLGGRGCRKFVPVLGGDGTKIAPPGDIFDQTPGEMS